MVRRQPRQLAQFVFVTSCTCLTCRSYAIGATRWGGPARRVAVLHQVRVVRAGRVSETMGFGARWLCVKTDLVRRHPDAHSLPPHLAAHAHHATGQGRL